MHDHLSRACLATLLFAQLGVAQSGPPLIDWKTDLAAARAQARAQDKPLLAVFRCEA